MKKIMLSLAMAVTSVAAFAQNSAIYKAEHFVEKGNYEEAMQLIDAALANPKTTKFAGFYYNKGEINRKLFVFFHSHNAVHFNYSFII